MGIARVVPERELAAAGAIDRHLAAFPGSYFAREAALKEAQQYLHSHRGDPMALDRFGDPLAGIGNRGDRRCRSRWLVLGRFGWHTCEPGFHQPRMERLKERDLPGRVFGTLPPPHIPGDAAIEVDARDR